MNVALLVLDTVRARSLTFGERGSRTATQLSEQGVTATNAFATAPWTLPSHASLFTGQYPSKHGAHAGHKRLEDDATTLAEVLSEAGYETVAVSNNTWISEEFGFDQGFETFYKTWQYIQSETDLGKIARQQEGVAKITKAATALFDGNPVTNLTNAVYGQFFRKTEDDGASQTNAWIDEWLTGRDDARPFFLFVNYLEPHLEYRPPRAYAEDFLPEGVTYDDAMDVPQDAWGYLADSVEMSEHDFDILEALYRAEISYLGERINDVVEHLKSAGEWDETILIITSDHGENIGEHGLMDHQYALYDTLLHVPLLVHGGPFEDDIQNLIQLVDIPPTILDLLGIEAPDARKQFQGLSFHPDTEETRRHVFSEYLAPQPSMEAIAKRVGTLPDHVRRYDRSLRAVRTGQYKFIRGSDGTEELYDVQADPAETEDIAATHDELVSEFNHRLDEWLDSFEHTTHSGRVDVRADTEQRLEDLGYLQ